MRFYFVFLLGIFRIPGRSSRLLQLSRLIETWWPWWAAWLFFSFGAWHWRQRSETYCWFIYTQTTVSRPAAAGASFSRTQPSASGRSSSFNLPLGHSSEPQGTAGVALALDDYMLWELLDAFKVPETCTRLVNHTSQFRMPPNIYPKLFKPLPLDDQVAAAMNNRGMSANSNIIDHRRIVKVLFKAFMGTWRIGWHSVILPVTWVAFSLMDSVGQ